MDKRKRNDFGSDDRNSRFDKKPGKSEYRGSSKGRTGTYTKKRDENTEFTGSTQGGRGSAERKGFASGRRGAGFESKGSDSGYRGTATENKSSDSGYRGAAIENKGSSQGYRGAASGNRGAAPGYRGAASGNRGPAQGYRGAASENRGPASGYRGAASENRGPASNYRGASPERSGYSDRRRPSSEHSGFSSDKRGFSSDRRDTSTYNRNAKKSAAEEKLPRDNKQEADIQRLQEDLDKLEGRNSVLEALKSGRSINRIFVSKGEREGSVNQIIAMARQNHIVIQEIDRTKLDEMSVTHAHQGVIALAAAKDYVEVDTILERAEESGKPPFIIILDEITDPYNLGSILRTANAAGVHGIIIPKRRAIGLTASVSKASAGAIEYVPVARVTNIVQTIEKLKERNIWIVGTDSTGEKAYFESNLTGPVALVIGSEGDGMGKLVRESCDFVVNIPMLGKISSLNAAVAGAIVTYEIFRQRSTKKS